MYLTMSDEIGTATGTIPVTAPDTWDDADHVDAEPEGAQGEDHRSDATQLDQPTDPATARTTKENHD